MNLLWRIFKGIEANLDLIRVAGHVTHPSFYAAADKAGMLIWQDMPLKGGYHNSVPGSSYATG